MNRFLPKLCNFLAFQITWALGMISVSRGLAGWGTALMMLNVAAHLAFNTPKNRGREAVVILAGALVGVAADAASLSLRLLTYRGEQRVSPEFLLLFYALWANFGTALRVSLGWTWNKLWAAAILGAIGGPIAYLSGARLGAVTLPERLGPSVAAFAVEFGVLTPAWIWIASRVLKERGA